MDNKHNAPPTKSFRFRAGCVFLTYSQCPLSKELAAAKFQGSLKWPNGLFAANLHVAVAQEKHADGQSHLHVLATFPGMFDTTNVAFFDLKHEGSTYHPNIQAPRSKAAVAFYITKEDKRPLLMNWDLPDWTSLVSAGQRSAKRKGTATSNTSPSAPKQKQPKAGDVVADLALSGNSIADMIQARPELRGYLLLHCRAVQHFQNVVGNLSQPKPKFGEVWVPKSFLGGEYPTHRKMFPVLPDRPHRAEGIWLHGPTSIGKTSMIYQMEGKGMLPYWFPYNNDHAQYQDGRFSFIVMDEFVGGVPINQMNALMDGRPLQLNTKGGSVVKKDRLLVIVISNKEPKDCYPNTNSLVVDALLARFHVIHWPHRHDSAIRVVVRDEDNPELQEVETEPEGSDAEEPEVPSPRPVLAAAPNLSPVMEQKVESSSKPDADDGGTTSSEDLKQMTKGYAAEATSEESEEEEESDDEEQPVRKVSKRFKSIFIDDEASE